MSLFLAKKQEELNQKKVKDLLKLKENKKCFDCPTKSPFFVNTTIQTFICARCSGLVREVGHRVKSISASKFSGAELLALKQGGNGVALKIWLSNYSTHDAPEPESDADVRAFMRQKYYENKWLDHALLQSHKEKVRAMLAKMFTEDGLPIFTKSRAKGISGFSRVPLIADSEMNIVHDDEEEEQSQLEQECIAVAGPPAPIVVANGYNGPTTFDLPPPTSPTAGRASMESNYSAFSAKSSTSVHSQVQEDYISKHRRSFSSSHRSVGSSRDSMDSTHFSTASGTSSGASILSAEEIAERCRSSIDSNSSQPLKCDTPPVIQEKPAPTQQKQKQQLNALQINVVEANKQFNHYQTQQQEQYYQHQQQQQLKSPTLINYGNSLITPSVPATIHCNASASASPVVTPSTSKVLQNSSNDNAFDNIIKELSSLKLEKTAHRATYNGGILSPVSIVSPLTPTTSTDGLKKNDNETKSRPTPMFDSSVFAKFQAPATPTVPENDPYAALRGIPSPVVPIVKEESKPVVEEKKEFEFPQDDDFEDDEWQEFCSSSSVDENEDTKTPAQVVQPVIEESKPAIAINLFADLDPRAMFRRI